MLLLRAPASLVAPFGVNEQLTEISLQLVELIIPRNVLLLFSKEQQDKTPSVYIRCSIYPPNKVNKVGI